MLLIEIVLMIWAFCRGWKFWALFPAILTFLIGVCLGFSDIPTEQFMFIDIICIIVLAYMVINKKEDKT